VKYAAKIYCSLIQEHAPASAKVKGIEQTKKVIKRIH